LDISVNYYPYGQVACRYGSAATPMICVAIPLFDNLSIPLAFIASWREEEMRLWQVSPA